MRRRSSRGGWCACRTPRSTRSPRAAARRSSRRSDHAQRGALGGGAARARGTARRLDLQLGRRATSSTSRRCSGRGAPASCATSPRRGAPRPRGGLRREREPRAPTPVAAIRAAAEPLLSGAVDDRASARRFVRHRRAPRRAARAADGGPARPLAPRVAPVAVRARAGRRARRCQAVELLAPRRARRGSRCARRCRPARWSARSRARAGPREPRRRTGEVRPRAA